MVAHAMFGDPVDTQLTSFILPHLEAAITSFPPHATSTAEEIPRLHKEKTLVVMEGPQFSTRAESNMYRMFGADIINMSSIPEAKLAREVELSCVIPDLSSLPLVSNGKRKSLTLLCELPQLRSSLHKVRFIPLCCTRPHSSDLFSHRQYGL